METNRNSRSQGSGEGTTFSKEMIFPAILKNWYWFIVAAALGLGLAMAFISHDLSVIRAVCDRVMVLQGGIVVEEGDCDAVFRSPQAVYTQTLIDAIPLPEIMPGWLDIRPAAVAAPEAFA